MSSNEIHRPVAVVGIALELPSGRFSENNLDYNSFWEFLAQKQDAYEPVPEERLQGIVPGFSVDGTFLKNLANFDSLEFGIGNKVANRMAVSTRKLVELSFRAMLDSGIDCRGKKIGSFMAGTVDDAFGVDDSNEKIVDKAYSLANRVSYILNITGPSFYVDTACSSSLMAMHLALQAIQNDECEGAVVGGCQINSNLFDWDFYTETGVTSADNSCKPFDAGANGFSKAEGAAVFVLKPLEAALADNDHIYSVILGSSINSNGARAFINVPSGIAQQECIQEAFARAGRDPTEVDFVELHATGTAVGDPIEANAAGEVFARDDPVYIGSVKGNTGHVESTAFLVSLAKVCLMLEHKKIPPNVHFTEPNSRIYWDKYRLRVATEALPLGCHSNTGRSLISVAGSGIGGSNGHIVVEGSPTPTVHSGTPPGIPVLFVIGGLTSKTVQSLSDSVLKMLSADSSPEALSQAVTLARRARQLPWRTHFTYHPGSTSLPDIPSPVFAPKVPPTVAMVFSGQGPQHIHMGRALFRTYKAFRDSIKEMDRIHQQITGISLMRSNGLFEGAECAISGLWPTEITLPALTMVQIALFDLLQSIGAKPDVLVGHSAGETALIYASGAGSKAMALEIAIARARAMKTAETVGGAMAALGCDLETASRLVAKVKEVSDGVLEIACHNSPEAFVVSGNVELVDKAVTLAQQESIFARKLNTSTPNHSSLMEPCKKDYLSAIDDVFSRYPGPCTPKLPTFSSVGGQEEMILEFTPEYFWQNMRSPVHFQQAVELVAEEYPEATYVEISPHPVLSSYIFSSAQRDSLCPMRREKGTRASDVELNAFTDAIAGLFIAGINTIDLTTLYGRASRDEAYDIPYPFSSRQFPVRIGGPRSEISALHIRMNAKLFPDLAQHVIMGEPIVPAAAYLDMITQIGSKVLWNVEFGAMLSLRSETPIHVRVERKGNAWSVVTGRGSNMLVHSKGFCGPGISSRTPPIDLVEIRERLRPIKLQGFYDALLPLAEFGPIFQRIEYLAGNHTEWFAEINGEIETHSGANYKFHPVLMDACVHFILHPSISQPPNKETIFLPHKMKRLNRYGFPTPGGSLYSHVKLVEWTPETRVYDVDIYDAAGICLCSMHRMESQKVSTAVGRPLDRRYQLVYQPVVINIPLKPLAGVLCTREDNLDTLYRWLDQFAQETVAKALASNPAVGTDIQRRRLISWARNAVGQKLPSVPSSVDRLKSDWPETVEIMEKLSHMYQQQFASSSPAIESLFSDEVMTTFYNRHNGEALDYATRAFEATITKISSNGKRALRILEVGTGTGTLTKRLVGTLENNPSVIAEYFATDISLALASGVTSACSYPYAIPKAYDLRKSLEEQNLIPGSMDVVTAFYVLHETPDVASTLDAIHRLLAPGGCLLVIELDGNAWERNGALKNRTGSLWQDFMFGCVAGWYGATDGRSHCAMTPQKWQSALETAGFGNVQLAADKNLATFGFIFSAQKSPRLPPTLPGRPDASFFTFQHGGEIRLQEYLYQLDVNEPLVVWLLASEGIDGDAAAGITPTLAKEFGSWSVCTAVFPDTMPKESDRIQAVLSNWDLLAYEQIVRFDEYGNALVAKVVPLTPLSAECAVFDPTGDWVSDGTTIKQSVLPPLNDREVTIEVLAWSQEHSSWRGFVGTVIVSHVSGVSTGNHFAGVTSCVQVSNRINCSVDTLAQIDKLDAHLAEQVLCMVIGALALGPSRFACSGWEICSSRILLPDATEFSQSVANFIKHPALGAKVSYLPISEKDHFELIVVDSSTASVHPELESWLTPKTGELFVWDTVLRRKIERKPWSIGHSLRTALKFSQSASQTATGLIRPLDLLKTLPSVLSEPRLFQNEKAYIILGGASDLGVQMALWMYNNGARHIILTSRRGWAFFNKFASTTTIHKMSYLQRRPDLDLRVEGFDAASAEAMSGFARSVNLPVGGCFIATFVMLDLLFMSQKLESFHSVADLKFNVFKSFISAFDIENIDFVVSLSSFITLLGNAGQSSYAVGNALIDGAISKYPNAFSMILPVISGLGFAARMDENVVADHCRWSFSPDDICASIGDALLKHARGDRFSNYIPDVAWNTVERDLGLTPATRHLFVEKSCTDSTSQADREAGMEQILAAILTSLDVSKSDFSPDRPLTSFGLDSFAATRISHGLRPYVNISQMQLLGGITWEQIQERMRTES